MAKWTKEQLAAHIGAKGKQKQDNTKYIGIDPAFRKSGFGVAVIQGDTLDLIVFKNGFLDFMIWFNDLPSDENTVIVVEDSSLINTSFDKSGNPRLLSRKSRNVGMNQATSSITVDICKSRFPTVGISPKEKGGKWAASRWEAVVKAGGYKLLSKKRSQDIRDATQLAEIAKNRFSHLLNK